MKEQLMRWRLVHARSVGGIATAIFLALACSSEEGGDGAGGAAGSSPDVHCVDLDTGCRCSADPNNEFDDTAGVPQCTPPASRNTWCCRTPDYPNTGSCECKAVGCERDDSACTCGAAHADGPLDTCQGAGHYYCCLTPAECKCTSKNIGCPGGSVVDTCDAYRATHCWAGMLTIPTCKGDKPVGTGGFSATGGTGGVAATGGFGGVGGTGAATGGGGLNSAECSACSATKCAPESTACSASPDCTGLIYCMDKCPSGGVACVQACISSNSAGAQIFKHLASCLNKKCNEVCGL